MKLFDLLFNRRKEKKYKRYEEYQEDDYSDFEDNIDWCIYDPDIVCDLFHDCQDCCYYEQWLRRGRKDSDTNFDEWNLDQSKFDFNHYDNRDEHD